MKDFDRRQILEGLAVLPWVLLAGCGSDMSSPTERARAILLGILDRIPLPDPLVIGQGFLAMRKHASADSVARDVLRPLRDATNPDALVDAIVREIRDDFATERILEIEGWFVARTEARLCALLTLLQPQ